MLARLLFAVLAATAGLTDEASGCDGFVMLGTGQPGTPTLYVTGGFATYEESNGVPGLQRGCAGEPDALPDRLVA